MTILYNYYTGTPAAILTGLRQSIAQYRNSNTSFKIGITANPNQRWSQHSSNYNWDRMVVIYKTTSYNFVTQVERELIAYTYVWDGSENQVGGGGGKPADATVYYVYFLLKK